MDRYKKKKKKQKNGRNKTIMNWITVITVKRKTLTKGKKMSREMNQNMCLNFRKVP